MSIAGLVQEEKKGAAAAAGCSHCTGPVQSVTLSAPGPAEGLCTALAWCAEPFLPAPRVGMQQHPSKEPNSSSCL